MKKELEISEERRAEMELVYNWHITERCNFACKYCFSKWNTQEEIWKDEHLTKRILTRMREESPKVINDLEMHNGGEILKRVTFAGGEPLLLGRYLKKYIKYSKIELGMDTSVITNGFLLEQSMEIIKYLDVIGISVDSVSEETCRNIGRATCSGEILPFSKLQYLVKKMRDLNPDIKIKINLVVNRHNWNELILDSLSSLNPDKIKVLRQMPFGGDPGIDDYMFETFMANNSCSDPKIFVENNKDMTQSYLMVDPQGRFFNNGNQDNYQYSSPIHKVGLTAAMDEIKFIPDRYLRRYTK